MSPTAALALRPDRQIEREQALAKLEQASLLLLEVLNIQDAKQIQDIAKAARIYASEQKLGHELIRKARAVEFEALRRIGELLQATARAPGGQPYQRSTGSGLGPVATLAELGIDKKTSSRAQQVYALPSVVFERVRDGQITLVRSLAEQQARVSTRERPVPAMFWKQLTCELQSEIRRIAEEMAEFPFTRHTFVEQRGCGSTQEVIPGCAGAPVYWDIVAGDPTSGQPHFRYSRGEVCARLRAFVDGGPRSRVSDLAVVVAQRRLAGDRSISRALLPQFIGDGNVVSLSTETYSHCIFLAQEFKTGTLEATIAAAVAFAHFSYSVRLNEEEVEAYA